MLTEVENVQFTVKDALGNRMKNQYEDRTQYYLPRRTYTIIRVDGRAFHGYTRNLGRPFDQDFMQDIDNTAEAMVKEMQGASFAYVQSDEISVLLTDFSTITTEAWFGGNLQKVVSIAASLATAVFNRLRVKKTDQIAMFDARAFVIPDPVEVENYFIWRQKDAERNSLQMVAAYYYPHQELQNKGKEALHDLLHEKGINWNDLSPRFKRGRGVLRGPTNGVQVWAAVPVFTQERDFLQRMIPVPPGTTRSQE